METKDKITKDDLILMHPGEQKVWAMPNWSKARSIIVSTKSPSSNNGPTPALPIGKEI